MKAGRNPFPSTFPPPPFVGIDGSRGKRRDGASSSPTVSVPGWNSKGMGGKGEGGREGGTPIQSEKEGGSERGGKGTRVARSHIPPSNPSRCPHPTTRPMGQRIHTQGRGVYLTDEGAIPRISSNHAKGKEIVPGRRTEGNRRYRTSDGSGDGWERRNEHARRRPRRTRPSGHAMEGTEAFQGNDPKTNEHPRVIVDEPIAGPKERKPRSYQRPEQDTGQERATESDVSPLFKAPVESPCSLDRAVATRAPTRSDATKPQGNVHKDAPAMLRRAS
eukprot:scaffold208_cov323-Pavlova_lutheri.AAC.10